MVCGVIDSAAGFKIYCSLVEGNRIDFNVFKKKNSVKREIFHISTNEKRNHDRTLAILLLLWVFLSFVFMKKKLSVKENGLIYYIF